MRLRFYEESAILNFIYFGLIVMRFFQILLTVLFLGTVSCHIAPVHKNNSTQDYPAYLSVVKRSDWGWLPLEQELPRHVIHKITIHHGGVEFSRDKNPLEYIRNLQQWSRAEKGWMDIPYHYMIDLDGKIYEARPVIYPGDTNTDYDVEGHLLICIIGNYEVQSVSEAQIEALVRLTAYSARRFDVPLQDIRGHKDYTETACPGKNVYHYLENGSLHRRVSALLDSLNSTGK